MTIGGIIINNITFADDTAIMAESTENLQIQHTGSKTVDKYKYMGAIINSQLDHDEEIKVRIEIVRKELVGH